MSTLYEKVSNHAANFAPIFPSMQVETDETLCTSQNFILIRISNGRLVLDDRRFFNDHDTNFMYTSVVLNQGLWQVVAAQHIHLT